MKENNPIETLGDALPKEIMRVIEIATLYRTVPMGHIAATLMMRDVEQAQKAMIEGDLVGMIHWYKKLKEWKDG